MIYLINVDTIWSELKTSLLKGYLQRFFQKHEVIRFILHVNQWFAPLRSANARVDGHRTLGLLRSTPEFPVTSTLKYNS
jgi:hypothetical protein